MVVADARGQSQATANQEVAHDGLEAGLATLKVRASKKRIVLAGVLDYSRVESVLRGAIQI